MSKMNPIESAKMASQEDLLMDYWNVLVIKNLCLELERCFRDNVLAMMPEAGCLQLRRGLQVTREEIQPRRKVDFARFAAENPGIDLERYMVERDECTRISLENNGETPAAAARRLSAGMSMEGLHDG